MGVLHFVGMFLLFAATVLLVFASVSTPVWNDVYYLKATGQDGSLLKLGNWGACYGTACTSKRLGYNLDAILEAGGAGRGAATVVKGLTYALVLNPIAAGFTFIALIFALGRNFALGIIASIWAFFSFLVTIVALAVDLGCFVPARNRLNRLGYNASLDKALWFVVAAAGAQLLASVLVCFTHSSDRRRRRNDDMVAPASTDYDMAQKRHFWQRKPRTTAY